MIYTFIESPKGKIDISDLSKFEKFTVDNQPYVWKIDEAAGIYVFEDGTQLGFADKALYNLLSEKDLIWLHPNN